MAINDEIISDECLSDKENKKPECNSDIINNTTTTASTAVANSTKEFRFEINSTAKEVLKYNLKKQKQQQQQPHDDTPTTTTIIAQDEEQQHENATTSEERTKSNDENGDINNETLTNNKDETEGGGGDVGGGGTRTVTVPQTLISCLDELQHNGKLVSWKIRGEGENLTVKVTWNSKNNERKYRKYTTSHFLNRKNDKNDHATTEDSGYITPRKVKWFSKLDESKISPLTLKQIGSDKKLKEELIHFKDALYRCLSELKVKKHARKMDKVEYDKLLLASRIELVSLITNLVQTLHIKLADSNLNKEKLEFDIKLIVFNEIENSLKLRTGSLLKEMDLISDSESDYPRAYEDYLATSILRKFTSKQTFSNLVDIMSANINSEDLTLKEVENVNWAKTTDVEGGESSFREDGGADETYTLRPKQQKFSVNDNLLLSLYSLMDESKKENVAKIIGHDNDNLGEEQQQDDANDAELDVELANNVRKVNNEQDNWSFRRSKKVSEHLNAATQNPVVMTIPQPNEGPFSPTIGDQDIEQLSDITLNDSNEENVNYEEDVIMDNDEIINEPNSVVVDETENVKFPIPKNILLNNSNKNSPKSSSYYRPNDDRLESDSDTELPLDSKRREEKVKISPKVDIKDPVFVERPTNKLIRIGETAKFQCKVDGTRPLEVFWYKMDEDELQNNEKYELFHDDEYYYLKIYNTVQRDVGTYLCVISNDIEQNFDSFTLNLRDNQRNFRSPKFILELSDIEVEEGYSATFKVKLDFGYPKCRVLFYRNSKLILNDPKHEIYYCGDGVYHLHLPFVTEDDNAQYTCVALNNGGRAVSKAELYVVERENIRRPDMMLKLNNSSYRSLDAFKFMDNDNKYFALTKSTDSFDNRSSSKSSSDINNAKNRTDTPSTVSYELLNDTYYDAQNNTNDIVLRGISNLNTPVATITTTATEGLKTEKNVYQIIDFKKDESNLNDWTDRNEHQEEDEEVQQQQQQSPEQNENVENEEEGDHFNESNETFMPKKYSPFIDNSLTLVTSPLTRPSDNLLSSSSVGSSILQIFTPRNHLQQQQLEQQQQQQEPLQEEQKSNNSGKQLSLTNDAINNQTSNFNDTTASTSNQNETQNSFNFNQDYAASEDDDDDNHGSYDLLNQASNANHSDEDNCVKNLSIKNFKEDEEEVVHLPVVCEEVKEQSSTAVDDLYSKVVPMSTDAAKKTRGVVGRLTIDPIIFERPIIESSKAIQSEYSSIKFEPVKERKKLWEQNASQSSLNIETKTTTTTPTQIQSNSQNIIKNNATIPVNNTKVDFSRKWTSLVSIYNDAAAVSSTRSRNTSIDKLNTFYQQEKQQQQQVASLSNINLSQFNNNRRDSNNNSFNARNLNNYEQQQQQQLLPSARPVLVEIVSFDGTLEKNSNNSNSNNTNYSSSNNQQLSGFFVDAETNDDVVDSNSASNIVQKLKQKFDHKDQSFVKVASLTCRNVYKDKSNQGNSNHVRPMLSLYEPSQCESMPKLDSFTQSGFSIESTTSINNGTNIATLTRTTITYNPTSTINNDSSATTTTTSSSIMSSSMNNSTSSMKSNNNDNRCITTNLVSKSNIHNDDDNKLKITLESNKIIITPNNSDSSSSPSSTPSSSAYCKIYDSTNDLTAIDTTTNNNNNNTSSIISNKSSAPASNSTRSGSVITVGKSNRNNLSARSKSTSNEKDFTVDYDIHVQDLVKDYKKLMSSNFINSRRKESVVLSKAKLWENRDSNSNSNNNHK